MTEYRGPSENGDYRAFGAAEVWPETVRALPVGSPITGEVVGRQPFGVFLSIDGRPEDVGLAEIVRMPPCMELPGVGQRVSGTVVWHDERNCQVRISLREWAEHQDLSVRFVDRVGQTVAGRVTKIASIGYFVRIADCVEGLVPVSGFVEGVREGQDVSVRIVSVDPERSRVILAAAGGGA
ncbi:S1 RNA-binding domain-containing protein [Streptomyces toxytricini]|uniref:S1 RNA-binding domain-containing protein n=1 Tax=Streptomyces toxytricini TaxID=67369 RepID=UPI0034292C8F